MKRIVLISVMLMLSVSLMAQWVNSTLDEIKTKMPYCKYEGFLPFINVKTYFVGNNVFVFDQTDTCRYWVVIPETEEDVKYYVDLYHEAFYSPSPNAPYWITAPYDDTNRTYKITIIHLTKDSLPIFVWSQNPVLVTSELEIDGVEVTITE